MHYLGIDYGEKRIGLSFADELGIAVPLAPILAKTLKQRLQAINQTIKTRNITAIVIGYPYNMDGTIGFKAKEVDQFIKELENYFKLPIHRIDERLTSLQAESDLSALSTKPHKKSIKDRQNARKTGDIDSRAATLILQDFLESQQS